MCSTCQMRKASIDPGRGCSRQAQSCPALAVRHNAQCRGILVRCRRPSHTEEDMRRQPIDPILAAEPPPPTRLCDHPGCEAGGDYRAPRSRLELDCYYWFCLEHVRAYN